MSQEKKGKITIANILALIGLAGIGVGTFFGIQLHSSDGTPGAAIIGAIALVAGFGVFFFVWIKNKKKEKKTGKVGYVGWGWLGAGLVGGGPFSTPFPTVFFFIT